MYAALDVNEALIGTCDDADEAARLLGAVLVKPVTGDALIYLNQFQKVVYNPNTGNIESDLDTARAVKWSEVKQTRDIYEFAGATTAKGDMQGDVDSQLRLSKAAFLAQQNYGTWPINWTMTNNSLVSHSAADIIAAWEVFCARSLVIHDTSESLRAQINAATTVDDVIAINVVSAFTTALSGGGGPQPVD